MSAFADTFPTGEACDRMLAPTGEPFDVLQGSGFTALDGAEAGAHAAFAHYAKDKHGTLYWRTSPETSVHGRVPPRKGGVNTYAFYMRLLISSKEVTSHG